MSELGASLRAARDRAGVSLAAMAGKTHYSKPLLGLIETGKRPVKPEHVQAYSRALQVPVDLLVGPSNDPIRIAHEWLVSDSPVQRHLESGRRIGSGLVNELENRVVELRHLDDRIAGRDLFPLVEKEFAEVQSAVNSASYDSATSQRLYSVVGELAQLAGWVASDAGRHEHAAGIYLTGVSATREAGNDVLTGQILSSLSYQMANVGNPADAALLARTAVKGANRATPIVRALLLERQAWASARNRDHLETMRTLDAVEIAFSEHAPGIEEPEWVYWLNRDEIDVMAGRCLIELGKPGDAEPLLTQAIEGYNQDHAREISLYLSWLAEAYARAGDVDAAQATLRRASEAGKNVNSARLDERIGVISRLATS